MTALRRVNFDQRTHADLAKIMDGIHVKVLEIEALGWINERLLRYEDKATPKEWENFVSAIDVTTKFVRQLSGEISKTINEVL